MGGSAVLNPEVERTDAMGSYSHQHVTWPRRATYGRHAEWTALFLEDGGLHCACHA